MDKRLFIGNLPFKINNKALEKDQIKTLFEDKLGEGSIAEVDLITDHHSGSPRGFGFVSLENKEQMQEAITQLNGTVFGGRDIIVSKAEERTKRSFEGSSDSYRGGGRGGDRRGGHSRGGNYNSGRNNGSYNKRD